MRRPKLRRKIPPPKLRPPVPGEPADSIAADPPAFLKYAASGLRLTLVFLAFLLTCPIRFHFPTPGLDPSYAVALNYFASKGGYVFGRDVAFTYGPLAWVTIPMGGNLGVALSIQVTIWLLLLAVLIYVALRRVTSLWNWAIFNLCLYAGAGAFWQFGYAGPDLFASFFTLFLLAMASTSKRHWWVWLTGAGLLAAALFLVKLSSGVLAASALAAWPVFHWLHDRKRGTQAAIATWIGIPVLFAVVFLLYHPSPAAMVNYVRASLDVASGYSVAMSLPDVPLDFRESLFLIGGYATLAVSLLVAGRRSTALAFAFMGPLFLTFKHAIVRPPGHVEILFAFTPLLVGLLALFTELPDIALTSWNARFRTWAPVLAFVVLAALWHQRESYVFSLAYLRTGQPTTMRWREAARAFDFPKLTQDLDAAGRAAMQEDLLPGVPNKPTAVFPWELSYAVANSLELRPLPVLQAYSAYTSYLDEWNARWLSDPVRAAPQIIFEWARIDGRHPLLDVPATFLQVLRHYDVTQNLGGKAPYGDRLLLSRRDRPRFGELKQVARARMKLREPLRFVPGKTPLVAKIHLNLTRAGAMRKFFYKVPELRMAMLSNSGRTVLSRVIADVLPGGVAVNFTPHDLASFDRLLRVGEMSDPFAMLQLSGEALGLYEPEAEVEWFEIPGFALAFKNEPAPSLDGLTDAGQSPAAHLEAVDGIGVMGFGANEVVSVNCSAGVVVAQGWAVDAGGLAVASGVYAKVGQQLFTADYGSPRDDVVAQFRSVSMRNSGFMVALPSAALSGGERQLTVAIRSADGKSVTWAKESIRLRCRGE